MIGAPTQQGYLLLPVALAIVLVAAVAFMMNHESALEANISGGELEADQAFYVAKAGLEHASWLADNSGCVGDLTLSPTPIGAHSYQARVESAATNTTSYTFNPDRDGWVKEAAPDDNFGSDLELSVKQKAGDSFRALYRFDLSSIPAGSRVVTATARFYVTADDSEGAVSIHALNADWTELGVTWNGIATQYDGQVFGPIPPGSGAGVWVALNFTALVQAWVNDASANHGILLIASSIDIESKYSSRKFAPSLRPYLEVTTADGDVSPLSIAATGKLDRGVTRGLTRDGVTAYQKPGLMLLQPGAALEDAYIWAGGHRNKNFGASPILNLKSDRNVLLRFNLTGLPRKARVTAAALGLYLEGGKTLSDGVLDLHRLTRPWVEGTFNDGDPPTGGGVTYEDYDGGNAWDSAGGDYDPTPIDSITIPSITPGWYEWDVTKAIQGWRSGEANHGFLLRANGGTVNDVDFTSGDGPTAHQHPRLTLTIGCECATPCLLPRGSGKVLLAVSDPYNPGDDDAHKMQLFESWGYRVDLIDDHASHAAYATALYNNDAAYVSASVSADTLAGKLASTAKGVINEEGVQNAWLGTSSDAAWTAGASLTVTDNTHYITALFPAGQLPIYAAAMEGLTAAGTLAGDLQTLAQWDAQPGLAVVDKGGLLHDGTGSAPGRRVMLPLGRHQTAGFDWNFLNNSGQLLVQRALEWAVEGGRMPPPVYVEAQGTWQADTEDSWHIMDLSGDPFHVPPNAVLEVAINNRRADRELWGGIRAVGSGLQRRFELHEAEAGGRDLLVMHVQADGGGRIEHYVEDRGDVEFTLLGYWNRGSYAETFAGFKAGAGAAWRDHALSAYGVGAGQVAEVVIVNKNESNERRGGIRSAGSSLNRTLELHEAEAGGVDAATMLVTAGGAAANAELWADVDNDLDFYLVGYWSTPPGNYTEAAAGLGSPAMDDTWLDRDLTGFGVPADAVVQIALANEHDSGENSIGARATSTLLDRMVSLHEAEAGGADIASLHVRTDAGSTIQWLHSDVSDAHQFNLLGWWEVSGP